jgi:DNA invertase Pin-like site-specific DNA recombinase
MKIGYVRISTKDQNFDLQTDALKKAGCKRLFMEVVITGARTQSKLLDDLMVVLRPRDFLVVWKLDHPGRSLKHLIEIVNRLNEAKIGLNRNNLKSDPRICSRV